jgi:hypothetical protein
MVEYFIDRWVLSNELDAIIATNDQWAVHLVLSL